VGAYNGVEDSLGELFPFLVKQLQCPIAQVRQMTCWTISRYLPMIIGKLKAPTELAPFLEALTQSVMDRNKKAQEYACSMVAVLAENAGDFLTPYLLPLLEQLMLAFRKYQIKSRMQMYDTLAYVADAVGPGMENPEALAVILPPLIEQWDALPDIDPNIHPLFATLGTVAKNAGLTFQDSALPVFQRSCRIIEAVIFAEGTGQTDENGDPPDKDFIVSSLDLLDGLVCGLRGNFEGLAHSSNVLNLLAHCLEDEEDAVRSSALVLIGDLAGMCPAFLAPAANDLAPLVVKNLGSFQASKVCSNAAWSLGECAMAFGDEVVGAHVEMAVTRLAFIINKDDCPPRLLENSAVALGRLSLSSLPRVQPYVAGFVEGLCLALQDLESFEERTHAFKGLCMIVQNNWEMCMAQCFVRFMLAVSSWMYYDTETIDLELRNAMATLIQRFCFELEQERGREAVEAVLAQMPMEQCQYIMEVFMQ